MADFRSLEVWHRARRLTALIYETTAGYPSSEQYGLTAQTRRAVVSIGANIAEGVGRINPRDTARFLDYAIGSTNEVEHHLTIASDLGYINDETSAELRRSLVEVRRMLSGLIAAVRARS